MSLPRIAAYDLLFPIARGGMATVFLALAQGAGGFERRVAIKVMHPHLSGELGPEELLDEARLAGRIRHPNVVPVIDVGQNEDGLFLVMEYVEGTTLSSVLAKVTRAGERLPLGVALRILSDALAGLHAAHELCDDEGAALGIVHRDFSPQNILLGVDGSARLTDFGIAKAKWRSQTTNEGMVKGKDGYMAPEQMRGHTLDRRCDVWAAGVVAWETLAGRRLFSADAAPAGVLEQILSGPLPLLHGEREGLPEAVSRAVARALSADVTARCPDAETFRRALLDGFAPEVVPADLGEVKPWVELAATARLASIEQKIRAARTERAGRVAAPVPAPSQPSGASPTEPTAEPETETVAELRVRPGRGRTWGALTAGAALVAVGALALLATRASSPDSSALPPAPDAAAEPVESATPRPTDSPSDRASSARVLVVRANAPVRRIAIGARVVELAPPRLVASVERTEEELVQPLRVDAADGRVVTVEANPSAELDVDFARPVVHRPTGTSRRTTGGKDILPSPYR